MTTLVLQAAGSVIGTAIGGPVGGMIGRVVGAVAGSVIDGQLFGDAGKSSYREGPRLRDMEGLSSTEGAPIPRLYGRARLGGQLIWATRFEEVISTTTAKQRGQGSKGSRKAATTTTTSYSYLANAAIGLCEGPVAFVRRVWADGKELDLTGITMRVHTGAASQAADPLILAKEGGEAPNYNGLAYVVFERFPVSEFGNRLPQFSFEVVKPVAGLNTRIRAVTLIPAAGEFTYSTAPVAELLGINKSASANRHQLSGDTDVVASLDQLQALCPNLETVSLVTTWFGDDLRAGACMIRPRVELVFKSTQGATWSVARLQRTDAVPVSMVNGVQAFGGSPSDDSVIALIREFKARGLKVVLYPFIMMDIAQGNVLPNPYAPTAGQAIYPWRGRITCHPAPGQVGSPDGTAVAAVQVAAFAGTATPADFALVSGAVQCAKPTEWSYRRFLLHHAMLAVAAGGVDGFIIGSEMIGLTRVRSASGVYPAVQMLISAAQDARMILGTGTKLTYAADWTEYGAHVLGGGTEVRFPLDPLWASPVIDAVGIDYYPPLADWRDSTSHADLALAAAPVDRAYLRANLRRGEAFDWYYADAAGRLTQTRLPITDGLSKPWIYRPKDIASWWLNLHVERVSGAELGSPTSWQPGMKPVWLTEFGVPAVDKGANGPNVFPDPKSSENAAPPFSTGTRDDLIQMRTLEAVLSGFDPGDGDFISAANPFKPGGTTRMLSPGNVFVWSWDARPFPAFPDQSSVWADGGNWATGHWITGRIEGVQLDQLVQAVLADFGLPPASLIQLDAFLEGYVIDRPMSARDALEPLARAYGFDALIAGGQARFAGRGGASVRTLDPGGFVLDREGRPFELRRAEESELVRELRLSFMDSQNGYVRATSTSRRLTSGARREIGVDTAVVIRRAEAQRLADLRLQEAWSARETISFNLSSRDVAIEPGDVISVPIDGANRLFRVTSIADGLRRQVEARQVEPAIYSASAGREPVQKPVLPVVAGPAWLCLFDLPNLPGQSGLLNLAVSADPWPGSYAVLRQDEPGGPFRDSAFATIPAVVGELVTPLGTGRVWRWDTRNSVDVKLTGTCLSSITDRDALAGGNALAIKGADGLVEVLIAATVTLLPNGNYRLSRLLRGIGGTEDAAARIATAGARCVVLDNALVDLTASLQDLGQTFTWRVAASGLDASDPLATAVTGQVGGRSLKPLSPVHLKARREINGIRLTWIRRTRIDGDAWEQAEVPLGEENESYRVTIISGSTIKRSIDVATAQWLYTTASEIADFGAAQSQIRLQVAQISPATGMGMITDKIIMVA
jgi:GTA TIM-barrel-like domain/Putative phage tail protein